MSCPMRETLPAHARCHVVRTPPHGLPLAPQRKTRHASCPHDTANTMLTPPALSQCEATGRDCIHGDDTVS